MKTEQYVIKVDHVRNYDPADPTHVYCGRAFRNKHYNFTGSNLGNPFRLGTHTREKAINLYREWLNPNLKMGDKWIRLQFKRLLTIVKQHGKLTLFCWCAPKACHCDVIKEKLLEKLNEDTKRTDR